MTKSLSMKLGKALDKSWRGQQKAQADSGVDRHATGTGLPAASTLQPASARSPRNTRENSHTNEKLTRQRGHTHTHTHTHTCTPELPFS